MSTKFQITLSADLACRLRDASEKQGIPLAQFIRETMEDRLRQLRPSSASNPLAAITGIATAEDTDLASRVDAILYPG